MTEALDVAVTGGEQDCELPVWRRMCRERVVDIVQPDVLYVGGICRALRVAAMAQAAGLPVTPMRPIWDWSRCSPCICCRHCQTPGNTWSSPSRRLTTTPGNRACSGNDPYRVEDGCVTVPSEPGWGVEIEPEWLARSAYQVSEAA